MNHSEEEIAKCGAQVIIVSLSLSWPSSFLGTLCSLWGRPGSDRPRLLAGWPRRRSWSGLRFASRAWVPGRWWCPNCLCRNIKRLALSASPESSPRSTCTPQWIQCSQLRRCCSSRSLASPSRCRPSTAWFPAPTGCPPSILNALATHLHSYRIWWTPPANLISMTQESSKQYMSMLFNVILPTLHIAPCFPASVDLVPRGYLVNLSLFVSTYAQMLPEPSAWRLPTSIEVSR